MIDNVFEVERIPGLGDLRVGDEVVLEIRARVVKHEAELIDVTGFSNSQRAVPELLTGQEKLGLLVVDIKRPV